MLTVPPLRPWCDGEQTVLPWCTQVLGAAAWAIGFAPASKPVADGVLCAGLADRPAADTWFGRGYERDALWNKALSHGEATGRANAEHALADAGHHVLIATWRASADGRDGKTDGAYWYVILCRPDQTWTPSEQRHARLTLRRMQAIWDYPAEDGLGRWLLGADGRVLHGDAQTQSDWPMDGVPKPAWAPQLHDVIRQRWVGATDERWYDMVFDRMAVEGGDVSAVSSQGSAAVPDAEWVRLFHRPEVAGLGGADYVETRPVDANDSPPVGVVDDERVGTALGYLIDRYAESPGLKDVASAVKSSPFHFHRLFSRIVGVSPKNYLLRTQLQMAKWRLRTGTEPVGDVAAAAGFASHGHFTATFHRLIGESPTDYRDRHTPDRSA